MTLQQHLALVGAALSEKEAEEQEILAFQLYLLCLGKAGQRAKGQVATRFFYNDHTTLEQVINPIWDLLNGDPYPGERNPLTDYLGDEELGGLSDSDYEAAFDDLLGRFARSRVTRYDHMQSQELTDLVGFLSSYHKGMSIYNPFAGVGSYACRFAAGDDYCGEEIDLITWAIGVMKLWMADSDSKMGSGWARHTESKNYTWGDSFHRERTRRFDLVVSTPPTGRVTRSADSGIPSGQTPIRGMETYADEIIRCAESLLNPGGTLLMVTTMKQIEGDRGRKLTEMGMLDMVVALPRNVLQWTPALPVIVRLKEGRDESEPILMADFTSLHESDPRNQSIIFIKIREAIEDSTPFFIQHVPMEKIRENEGNLNPSAYVSQDGLESDEGMVPLRNLGCFLDLPRETGNLPRVNSWDLYSGGSDVVVTPVPSEYKGLPGLRLAQPAFLIFANHHGFRYAYVFASEKAPVSIDPLIYAFVPDEMKVLVPYLAEQLPNVEFLFGRASFRWGVTFSELSQTRVPMIPIEEQKEKLLNEKKRFLEAARLFGISQPETEALRTPIVVLFGSPLPEKLRKMYKLLRSYSDGWVAVSEIPGIRKAVDAVIINDPRPDGILPAVALCNSVPDLVHIITNDPSAFTGVVKMTGEEFRERCSPPGAEEEMFVRIQESIRIGDTPEGRTRNRFAAQLNAIEKIEAKFPDLGSIQDTIQKIIISDFSEMDWINKFRVIRDNCLGILSRFGYVPPIRKRFFDLGAVTDLLADRVYLPDGRSSFYVLLKNPLESDALGTLLKASKRLLNEGSHELITSGRELQETVLLVLFALLRRLSEMIELGYFEEEQQGVKLGFWREVYMEEYDKEGDVSVSIVKDSNYIYAGNVHLEEERCQKLGLREGDRVRITRDPTPEKKPVLPTVWFYTKYFERVE